MQVAGKDVDELEFHIVFFAETDGFRIFEDVALSQVRRKLKQWRPGWKKAYGGVRRQGVWVVLERLRIRHWSQVVRYLLSAPISI